ncbi:hypothetical protein V1525DRAFT_403894 [Lipomyces kononenkoae]|uniref:Uncharacterized protein n=1 Tax=Lipomyces kononenkoae TaxID=34357 RepID=A0ACC3T0I2_LIPKO
MSYHRHSRSYSASRRTSSGMMWAGHSRHPSIPENEVLPSPTDSVCPPFESLSNSSELPLQQEATEYDRSVEMLVQDWMASNPTPPPGATSMPTSSGASSTTQTDLDTQPDLPASCTATKSETTTDGGHSCTGDLTNSYPGFRSFVVWGNRKVVINIPRELMNEPELLSTTELRDYERRVHEWAVQNYNLIKNQFPSSRDASAFYNALSSGKATVRIPDEKAWKDHVEFLREQKLLALGVSSPALSDAVSSPRAMTPSHYAMPPDLNVVLSGYNALNIYAPQSVAVTANMQHHPSVSSAPSFAPRLPSTVVPATVPAFVQPPFTDDFAYRPAFLEAPIGFPSTMHSPSPIETNAMSYHQHSVSDLSGTVSFVRPPKDSKRIPIIDPNAKASKSHTQANGSITTAVQLHKPAANGLETPQQTCTPIVRDDTPAKDLPADQLDDIVQRLTEHSPAAEPNSKPNGDAANDDDSDSVWSDSVVKANRQRLVAEAMRQNTVMDDSTLQVLLANALSKKLGPLEKLVSMLTDQLKSTSGQQPGGHASDADDEGDEDEDVHTIPGRRSRGQDNDGVAEETMAAHSGSLWSSHVSSAETRDETIAELRTQLATSTSRMEALLSELEEARRARERADAIVSELTNKIVESERACYSVKGKLDTSDQEIAKLRDEIEKMKSKHVMELDEKADCIRRDTQREYLFAVKEYEIQREQTKFLQEQVNVLNDKLEIAAVDSDGAVEKIQNELDRVLREKEDALNSRATELSWLRGLLDTRIEELDEQARILKSFPGETIDRQVLQTAYTSSNSAFLAKLKFGIAMSLVSDDFVQLISSVSESFVARGISHKDHRRRLSRQIMLENIMPLNEHNSNIPSNPSRIGYSGGLKDLKLNRAATIHGSAVDREEVRQSKPFREI